MKNSKRITSRVMALIGCALLLFTIFAVPVGAATTVVGTSTNFNKYLVMKEEANVPNVTFEYTIETIASDDGDDILVHEVRNASGAVEYPRVYASAQLSGVPSITPSVSFAPGDETYTEAQPNNVLDFDTVELDANEKYAIETLTLDFSAVTYEKPGVYRYKLTEVKKDVDGVTFDNELVRYCDVYVNQKAGSAEQDLEITGYAIHKSANEIPALDVDNWNEHEEGLKDNGYQNDYETYNLTIEKQITGNHGWKNNYFEFTLKIDGVLPGSRYDLVLDDATSDKNTLDADCVKSRVEGGKTVYYLEADANGDLEYTFYLSNKGGNAESIQVLGLTAATKYFVEEDCQDYDPSWKISEVAEDGATLTDKASGTLVDCLDKEYAMGTADNLVVFTNDREVNIVTGLNMDVLPIVIVIAVVAVAAIAFVLVQRKKAKKAHEEE